MSGTMQGADGALARLEAVVRARLADGAAQGSYVATLAQGGLPRIAQKVGEEATETIIAALASPPDPAALTAEAADLVFHLTVLLAAAGLDWAAVGAELDRRHGRSGLVEKAARQR